LTSPAHPYTELLMEAVPQVGRKWSEQVDLPDLETVEFGAMGCKFAGRCRYAQDVCRRNRPPMVEMPGGRRALCFRPVNYQMAGDQQPERQSERSH
jgi:peptide/nickel transport system ATP-binding protein